jgi:hypothetical protein
MIVVQLTESGVNVIGNSNRKPTPEDVQEAIDKVQPMLTPVEAVSFFLDKIFKDVEILSVYDAYSETHNDPSKYR